MTPTPTPLTETAERVAKFEARLKLTGDFVSAVTVAGYAVPPVWCDDETIDALCADLRSLLAERAALAEQRDRLAGALKAARGWVVTCSSSARARQDLARIDAALKSEKSDG